MSVRFFATKGERMTVKNPRAITVRSLDAFKGPGRMHCGVKGLFLQATRSGSKIFIFRYVRPTDGKTTETSVGPYGTISLSDAREKVAAFAREVALGHDPIADKRQRREKARAEATTFRTALDAFRQAPAFKDLAATAKLVERLDLHADALMSKPLTAIDTRTIAAALANVHARAPHTARRTLAGVARVLAYAKIAGLRTGDNPAAFEDNFELLWGPGKPVVHLRAVAYDDVPAVYARLVDLDTSAAWCLRWLILTATRTSNALYATFDQIDLDARTWTIASDAMKVKGRDAFVVPLVDETMAIVVAMRERHPSSELMFPASHGGKLHPRMLTHVLHRGLGVAAAVHGFRSSARDFWGDRTSTEREVAEMCLAHFPKGVEAAYRRSSAIDKRRVALTLWARHVVHEDEAGGVIPFKVA
jgi:integrase